MRLDPCPFCGSRKTAIVICGEITSDQFYASCFTCYATGPVRIEEDGGTNETQARSWWNTRRTAGRPLYRKRTP